MLIFILPPKESVGKDMFEDTQVEAEETAKKQPNHTKKAAKKAVIKPKTSSVVKRDVVVERC